MAWEMTDRGREWRGAEWLARRGDEWLLLRRWADGSWRCWSRTTPTNGVPGWTANGALRAEAARQTDPEVAAWIRSLPEPC